MIYLITGTINSGKTSKMLELYRANPQGDGIVCPKVFENGHFLRYDILHLKSGKTLPFAYPVECIPESWDERIIFGKFSFSVKAFDFAEACVYQSIHDQISPFFLDEIGPLELDLHTGFYSILKKLLSLNIDLYISVRKSRINDMTNFLGRGNIHVIFP